MANEPKDFGEGGVFILGGSGGLGSAICRGFAAAGVPVALTYRTNSQAADLVADDVRSKGVEARTYAIDGADIASITAAMADAAAAFGGLHSVIYAGGPTFEPEYFGKTKQSVWREWLEGDLLAAINLAQAGLPHLRQSRGAYVAVSTYQADLIEVRGAPSAISKAAVDRMVAVIAKEEGRFGVRANTVRCGWFDVEANQRLFEKYPGLREEKVKGIPLRQLGQPEDIANVMLFLCSRRAAFVTGINLTADGGESL